MAYENAVEVCYVVYVGCCWNSAEDVADASAALARRKMGMAVAAWQDGGLRRFHRTRCCCARHHCDYRYSYPSCFDLTLETDRGRELSSCRLGGLALSPSWLDRRTSLSLLPVSAAAALFTPCWVCPPSSSSQCSSPSSCSCSFSSSKLSVSSP
jgi:hypothetical protein